MTGDALRNWREANDWSQAQAAALFPPITRHAWQKWEAGTRPIPARVAAWVVAHPAPPTLRTARGAQFHAWRLAHGWTIEAMCLAMGYAGTSHAAVARWEQGATRLPVRVQRYMLRHPPPAAVERYPQTPEGLVAAIRDKGLTRKAWCAWWGVVYKTMWDWVAGRSRFPVSVAAWLRAGAPDTWQHTPPPRESEDEPAPAETPRAPRKRRPVIRTRGDHESSAALRVARETAGLTRVQAAQLLNIHLQTLLQWEVHRPPPVWALVTIQTHAPQAETGWVSVPGVGWVPPAGYCAPERDALRLAGCERCGYRTDCLELHGDKRAS